MSDNTLSYKGFAGSIETSVSDGVLFGKILFIDDKVTYEASTVPALKKAFEHAVDDYLKTCEELGIAPGPAYKGSFNVRVGCDLHRLAAEEAARSGIGLNDLVKNAIRSFVDKKQTVTIKVVHEHRAGAAKQFSLIAPEFESVLTEEPPVQWDVKSFAQH